MANRSPFVPGLLLWLASLATAVIVSLALAGPDVAPADAAPRPVTDDPGLAEVRDQLVDLERELAELRLSLASRTTDAPRDDAPEPLVMPAEDGSLTGLEARLARLEHFEGARQQVLAEQAAAQAREREAREALQGQLRAAAHAVILDPERSDSEKAHAFRDLRDITDQPWTDEVVLEAIRVAETSTDDRAREVVWIGADTDHRNDLLVGPLMRALTNDRTANVREEAADALGRYLDMPGVLEALRQASLRDGSDRVRREALEALAKGG